MLTFKQFLKEEKLIGIYSHGFGSDVYDNGKKPKPETISNRPTNTAFGIEGHKDDEHFQKPKIKSYVDRIRKDAAKGNRIPPVVGTHHPDGSGNISVLDGNHRLRGIKNAKLDSISVEHVPHENVHLMKRSYYDTPDNQSGRTKIKKHGVPLSSFRNSDGTYDMDKPREELGGKAIRHYFNNYKKPPRGFKMRANR